MLARARVPGGVNIAATGIRDQRAGTRFDAEAGHQGQVATC